VVVVVVVVAVDCTAAELQLPAAVCCTAGLLPLAPLLAVLLLAA
jgi:hypothetical protein